MNGTSAKWVIVCGAVLLALLCGLFVASPFLTARAIQHAIANEDAEELGAHVDSEAVKTGLRENATGYLLREVRNGGLKISDAEATAMIEAAALYGSPRGIIEELRVGLSGTEVFSSIAFRTGYLSPDRFIIRTHYPQGERDGPLFVMRRKGPLTWKVVRMEVQPKP